MPEIKPISRDQWSRATGGDPEVIRVLEKLVEAANSIVTSTTLPADTVAFSDSGSTLTGDPLKISFDSTDTKLGVGVSSPSSTVDVGGSLSLAKRTVTTSPVTLDKSDNVVLCDCSSTAITVNLPAASSANGRIYYIKKIDSTLNTVTIDPDGSETIDGKSTQTLFLEHELMTVQSDGSAWFLL